jgi:hypothetical protein
MSKLESKQKLAYSGKRENLNENMRIQLKKESKLNLSIQL